MDSERNFEYCMVGNIIDKHYYGEQKLEIRRGTKQFRPNAKVYIFPEFPGMGHENIVVIGKPRKPFSLPINKKSFTPTLKGEIFYNDLNDEGFLLRT